MSEKITETDLAYLLFLMILLVIFSCCLVANSLVIDERLIAEGLHKWQVEILENECKAQVEQLIAGHRFKTDGLIARHLAELESCKQTRYKEGIANERQRQIVRVQLQYQKQTVERAERIIELEKSGTRCAQLKENTKRSEDPRCMLAISSTGQYANSMGLCALHYRAYLARCAQSSDTLSKRQARQMVEAVRVLQK